MNRAPFREDGESPRHRRSLMRVVVLGAILLGVVVLGGLLALREPRFSGRTVGDWIDSFGPPEPARMRGHFRANGDRKSLEGSQVALLPAVERELQRSARRLNSLRDRYALKVRLWGELARLQFLALKPAPPVREEIAEKAANAHLVWSTAWLLEVSPSPVAGLQRFETVVPEIPGLAIEASLGFRAITDTDGSLTAALKARLQSTTADTALRPVWLSCLGHLGAQASSAADLVRSLTRDLDALVRYEAIKALGTLDSRPDTAEFLRGCAKDAASRQAVMLALAQMPERAQGVEAFIRENLQDPDMLTGLFAKFALEALERKPAESGTSGHGRGVP